jgi:hypothetical protein
MLDLAIIIVNFNTRDYLRQCLKSIYASQGGFAYQVCVVDNASVDSSLEMMQLEFPQTQLIQSSTNGGFAYANNLGLRAYGFAERPAASVANQDGTAGPATARVAAAEVTLPRYVLLLNPDTVLPADALRIMLEFMDTHPQAGAVGPKLILEDGRLDLACRRSFPTPTVSFYRMAGLSSLFPNHRRFGQYNLTYLDPDQMAEVDSVVGAFMLVRRQAIQQAGLLDEIFFMYGEDLDWAYRMRQRGWKTYYYPVVTILHVKRAASRHSSRAQEEFYRAMRVFYFKHYAATTPRWLHWLVLTGINLRAGWLHIQRKIDQAKRASR